MPSFDSNTPPAVAEAWADYAPQLARWTFDRMVNRIDAWVQYLPFAKRTPGDSKSRTFKGELNLEIVERHYRGADVGHLIALHTTTPPNPDVYTHSMSKWCGLDHDNHKNDATIDHFPQVLQAWEETRSWHSLLFDSNGAGGFHNLLLFDDIRRTEEVYQFAKWWGEELPNRHEFFPKQPWVEPEGRGHYGNVLRLPGRHHTRNHYTKVWTGSDWAEGEAAIKLILANSGSSKPFEAFIIPADEFLSQRQEADEARRASFAYNASEGSGPASVESVRSALGALAEAGYVNDYDQWLRVGMALASLGSEGFNLWDEWSQAGSSYDPGVCEQKWAGFSGGDGLTVKSIFHWAMGEKWVRPSREQLQRERMRNRMSGYLATKATQVWDDDNEGEDATPSSSSQPEASDCGSGGSPAGNWVLKNFAKIPQSDGEKPFDACLRTPEIVYSLDLNAGGWPKKAGGKLFVADNHLQPQYIDSPTKLFAWADRIASVDWRKGSRFVTQERFYESLKITRENYATVEGQPHWPPMRDTYYLHPELPTASGHHLTDLLDRFTPATVVDREFIKALILTLYWGGTPGSRPAFLITGPAGDTEGGRGIGKSTLVDVIADELTGGSLDVAQNEGMDRVRTRMLSPDARSLRVARIDNIKTLKLSWADLEGMITSTVVSGHEMYEGEGRRPNTFTWVLTQNGGALSKDMAQRVIVVKLERPEHKPGWAEEIRNYIRSNRLEILADIGDCFNNQSPQTKAVSRWASWEQEVLARCDNLAECQKALCERQGAIDDDTSERDLVIEHFRHLIAAEGKDPDTCRIFLSSKLAAEWLKEALGKPFSTTAASTFLSGLAVPELSKKAGGGRGGRGWHWLGTLSDPTGEITPSHQA